MFLWEDFGSGLSGRRTLNDTWKSYHRVSIHAQLKESCAEPLFLFRGTGISLIAILILPAVFIWDIEKRISLKCLDLLRQRTLLRQLIIVICVQQDRVLHEGALLKPEFRLLQHVHLNCFQLTDTNLGLKVC